MQFKDNKEVSKEFVASQIDIDNTLSDEIYDYLEASERKMEEIYEILNPSIVYERLINEENPITYEEAVEVLAIWDQIDYENKLKVWKAFQFPHTVYCLNHVELSFYPAMARVKASEIDNSRIDLFTILPTNDVHRASFISWCLDFQIGSDPVTSIPSKEAFIMQARRHQEPMQYINEVRQVIEDRLGHAYDLYRSVNEKIRDNNPNDLILQHFELKEWLLYIGYDDSKRGNWRAVEHLDCNFLNIAPYRVSHISGALKGYQAGHYAMEVRTFINDCSAILDRKESNPLPQDAFVDIINSYTVAAFGLKGLSSSIRNMEFALARTREHNQIEEEYREYYEWGSQLISVPLNYRSNAVFFHELVTRQYFVHLKYQLLDKFAGIAVPIEVINQEIKFIESFISFSINYDPSRSVIENGNSPEDKSEFAEYQRLRLGYYTYTKLIHSYPAIGEKRPVNVAVYAVCHHYLNYLKHIKAEREGEKPLEPIASLSSSQTLPKLDVELGGYSEMEGIAMLYGYLGINITLEEANYIGELCDKQGGQGLINKIVKYSLSRERYGLGKEGERGYKAKAKRFDWVIEKLSEMGQGKIKKVAQDEKNRYIANYRETNP
ncbi:hypothetical protein BWI96_11765 [Siphonobacter sp. SORGH_AS_0500]|uniref:hypothetical protein n=1 Tax=Siphonobacter sp. SORGH_AS_0500 TaxID=1864824 RepID=UPI000CC07D45|nr:hypothetical protein [Siphonobacter sp. SORGH_AS_0500]PKK36525.1 hypothetical protein BWI96_11765 [Siphonobacter sp. SORGH_AS_0500]